VLPDKIFYWGFCFLERCILLIYARKTNKYANLMSVPCIIGRSRNNQHNAQICTTALFYMLAPTCFGSSLPSSGGFWIRLSYFKIQICSGHGRCESRNSPSSPIALLNYAAASCGLMAAVSIISPLSHVYSSLLYCTLLNSRLLYSATDVIIVFVPCMYRSHWVF
jgi:hypothetical protein